MTLKYHLFDHLCAPALADGKTAIEEQEEVLNHLARLFCENQQDLKFAILERLITFLSHCEDLRLDVSERQQNRQTKGKEKERDVRHRDGASGACENLQAGVFHILASKVGQHQRDMALSLCSLCLQRFGEEWAVGTLPTSGQAGFHEESGECYLLCLSNANNALTR